MELPKNRGRDWLCGIGSGLIILGVLSIFAVIFIVSFVQDWPYQTGFSMEHFRAVFQDAGLVGVYKNSLYVALLTAVFGTLAAYGSALITARSSLGAVWKRIIDGIALVTNTIPGMVLGLAFLFCFSGTGLQSTFAILVLCNVVHFFSTPYLMMKIHWKNECFLGDHCHADGRQLVKNDPSSCDAECHVHNFGSIQLLLCQCNGHSQCRGLSCRSTDYDGIDDKDQGITVLQ